MTEENSNWFGIRSGETGDWWEDIPGEENEFPMDEAEYEMSQEGLTFDQYIYVKMVERERAEDYSSPFWRNKIASTLLTLSPYEYRDVLEMADTLIKAGYPEDTARACIVRAWKEDYHPINALLCRFLFREGLDFINARQLLFSALQGLREQLEGRAESIVEHPELELGHPAVNENGSSERSQPDYANIPEELLKAVKEVIRKERCLPQKSLAEEMVMTDRNLRISLGSVDI